ASTTSPVQPPGQQVGTAPAKPAPVGEPPARAGGRFAWPVKGPVLAGYGPAGPGLHNDGINIAVPTGTPVKASENGVVVYAGNELKGFGNLLLLKHDGGWMTAYAHNSELLVPRGATVKKGDVIAKSGATGNVDRPQVHFELRKGTKAVDPTKYLEGSPSASLLPAGGGGATQLAAR
ncbi:M23 family metallopeptidase, partial [Caenispirillum bisanense]|uniref:murein hydrolase activator EnvC family protein n=1 Tax=Caenispirillum bisanense TaxID=414052 RepID=UPI0031DF7807